jgi:hypothetical protein
LTDIVSNVFQELPATEDEIFHCDMCPKIFFNNIAMRKHRTRHLGSGRFVCPYCRITTVSNQALDRHCQAVHGKVRSFPAVGKASVASVPKAVNPFKVEKY